MIDYYERQGIAAWSNNEVPFRITSNPFIAKAYAQVIHGYFAIQRMGPTGPSVRADW
jgi:hypothetical protein